MRSRWQPFASVAIAVLLTLTGVRPALADDLYKVEITQLDPSDFPNVRVVASVVDRQGRAVTGLTPADVAVSEDGRRQSPSVELASKNAPIALALALDTSGSMTGRPLSDARAAIATLIQSLGPEDQAAVLTFNTSVTVRQPLTSDQSALLDATDVAANGNTAIFDAVAKSMDLLAGLPPRTRRAIVLLTDGVDNSSSVSLKAVSDRIAQQGYPVYVVGLGTDLDRPVLQRLADASSGGQAYVAPTSSQLAAIYSALSQRILTQYALTYRSDVRAAAEGSTLTVTVQIVRSGVLLGFDSETFVVPAGKGIVAPSAVPTRAPVKNAVPAPEPAAASGPYSPEVVALLGTASALSLLLWLLTLSTRYMLDSRQTRRVAGLVTSDAPIAPARRRSFWQRVGKPLVQSLGRPLARVLSGFMAESTRRRLQQAGEPLELGPVEFFGLQIAGAFIGVVLFTMLSLLLVGPQLLWVLLLGIAGGLFGLAVPLVWLDRSVRLRKRRILRALPSALDMLALSARAGMTFDGSLAQVAARWESALTDEFRRTLVEFRMGRDRREALRAMADRTGVTEVTRFANAVIQADALGVPISKVLHDQAIEMRTRRRQRAEEAARKAPIKMLFPMVGFIFPALFVVILGPAVPRLLEIFRVVR